MATFNEANQVRLALKMKLSNYSFYSSSLVITDPSEGYKILVNVNKLDDSVKKIVPNYLNNVIIKTELE